MSYRAQRRFAAVLLSAALVAPACASAADGGGAETGEAETGEAATGEAATGEAATGEAATGEAENGEAETAVSVEGFRFQPQRLEVPVGTTVVWTNRDGIDHTATAGTPETPEEAFAIDMPEKGASGSHTFTEPGTYAYFCEVHESMRGEVVVGG